VSALVVAKLGGSLFDLPDLRDRVGKWVAGLGGRRVLLVPGGGAAADVVRRLDEIHHLGEERAHWLALRMVSVNACFLSGLLGVPTVTRADGFAHPLAVLDVFAFCRYDEDGALEHSWRVTSDSVAARVAAVAHGELVLLKSTDLSAGMNWVEASDAGLVDAAFGKIVARTGIAVSWVNLRACEFNSTR
jgi:aspartokinase-like uncharacterized kinase